MYYRTNIGISAHIKYLAAHLWCLPFATFYIYIQNSQFGDILFCLRKCVFLLIFYVIHKCLLTGRTTSMRSQK